MDFTKIEWTILKEICRDHRVSLSGTRAEIIQRLQEADPSGDWIQKASDIQMSNQDDENQNASASRSLNNNDESNRLSGEQAEREIQLLRRERELVKKELELIRRERNLMRDFPTTVPMQEATNYYDIDALKDLLGDFDGDALVFKRWKNQFQLLITTYALNDGQGRVLLSTKLKGKAQKWFHSKPEFIGMTVEQILQEMEDMFGNQESRVDIRRKFENRIWNLSESFSDYYYEKLILANTAAIEEEEDLIEYLIEGIPDQTLRNMARIQSFKEKRSLFKAFEKISLTNETKKVCDTKNISSPSNSNTSKKNNTKKNRCYNCVEFGHLASDCKLPARPKGACFKCFELGHTAKNCSNKRKQTSQSLEDNTNEEANNVVEVDNGSVDEARSEATFRFTVDNVSKMKDSQLSAPCYVRNLPWKIMVMPRSSQSQERQPQRSLGFFLQCNVESKSTSWSCYAEAELRILSCKQGQENYNRKIQHRFCDKEDDWGFSHFMTWQDVLNPDKGYIKDDTITLEVHVVANAPLGIN